MLARLGGLLAIACGVALPARAVGQPAPAPPIPVADAANPLGVPRDSAAPADAATGQQPQSIGQKSEVRGRRSQANGPPVQAGPIATRQTAFLIPFQLDDAAVRPVEVLLFVSEDGGRTWKPGGRAKPEQGNFRYRAPHDGQYEFAIATVDARAKLHPQRPERSELTVTVDTVVPRLDLWAWAGPDGELVVRWQAADPLLQAESFKLDFQSGPKEPWQPLGLDEPPAAGQFTLSGESTWWVNLERGGITVRAQVLDRAGNLAVRQAPVTRDTKPPLPAAPTVPPVDPLAQRRPPAAQQTAAAAPPLPAARPWPADRGGDPNWHAPSAADGIASSNAGDGGQRRPADGGLPVRDPFAAARTSSNAAEPTSSRVPARNVTSQRAAGAGALDFRLLPPGERPRMVNSQQFDLDYDVESVGPSGIAKVELWTTTDGGRNWSLLSTDDDNRSPVHAVVPGEGLYGFCIVVQNGAGLGGRAPRSGDAADFWIGVDLTPPAATITALEALAASGELAIRYAASDERLEPRPVSLSYAATPEGPWSPIAAGLENSGSYVWRMDSRVPELLYVKLEARDEAGNVGVFVSAEPLALLRERPEARIRGVRPREGR